MKCLILAAGYATRLYPLTENFPKPLLKVGDKTILDWLLDDIDTISAISEYIVITNHKFARQFEEWAKTKKMKITVLDDGTETNETRLGAVRDIELAIERYALSEDLLVIAGDNVLDFSLTSFIKYAQSKNTSCVMRYYEPSFEKLLKCGVVTTDENDKIIKMTEKSKTPETHWCTPPFYFYKKEDLHMVKQAIEDGCPTDAPGSFIAYLSGTTTVCAMEMPGKRYDIGNLESYERVQKDYKGIIL